MKNEKRGKRRVLWKHGRQSKVTKAVPRDFFLARTNPVEPVERFERTTTTMTTTTTTTTATMTTIPTAAAVAVATQCNVLHYLVVGMISSLF